MAGHGGTVSRRTAHKKLTKLCWPSRKRSPKTTNCAFRAKKWRPPPHFLSWPVPPLSNSFRRHRPLHCLELVLKAQFLLASIGHTIGQWDQLANFQKVPLRLNHQALSRFHQWIPYAKNILDPNPFNSTHMTSVAYSGFQKGKEGQFPFPSRSPVPSHFFPPLTLGSRPIKSSYRPIGSKGALKVTPAEIEFVKFCLTIWYLILTTLLTKFRII